MKILNMKSADSVCGIPLKIDKINERRK